MADEEGLYASYILLAFSVCICIGITFWLCQKTDVEKYVDYISKYNRLYLYERFEDAKLYRSEILKDLTGDELNEIWLSTVQEEEDNYLKLQLYLKLLKGNPEREASYKEIASLIKSLTNRNQINEKQQYLKKLNEIPGLKKNWLEKYDLLTIDNN